MSECDLLISDLLEHLPADGRVEFETGAVVVAVPGHHYDERTFDAMIGAGTSLTARLTATVAGSSAA